MLPIEKDKIMKTEILQLNGVAAGYGPKIILSDIGFSVEEGELIGLIGPNGSGKTTLLRAITKIIPLKKGSIYFKGIGIDAIPIKDMAKEIAVVRQSQNEMFFTMSVGEFVELGRIPHIDKYRFSVTKNDLYKVRKAMFLTEVLGLKNREISSLSGGERQRVFLARALAQDPKLLLLDEPTTHLDIGHIIHLFEIIQKLIKEKNMTILCVMHDLNLASEYCDRLILLNRGGILKIGKPEEVINQKNIKEVYKADIKVQRNPVSSKPYVLMVSEEAKVKQGEGV